MKHQKFNAILSPWNKHLATAAVAVGMALGTAGAAPIINDTFTTDGNANSYGWYYLGTNLDTGGSTVSGGNLLLGNTGSAPGNNSAVWRPFNSTTLANGDTLRLRRCS